MTPILTPIQKLAQLLTGLTSDTGEVIQRIITGTPLQPEPADFPLLVIEVDPETDIPFQMHTLGHAHMTYTLNVFVFVGTPAAGTPLEELHNLAAAWVFPLGARMVSDISLGAEILMQGFGGVDQGSEDVFRCRIQGIPWNGKWFYGVAGKLPLKEEWTTPMA